MINQRYIHDAGYRYSIELLAKDTAFSIDKRKIKTHPLEVIKALKYRDDLSITLDNLWLRYIILKNIAYNPDLKKQIKLTADQYVEEYIQYFKNLANTVNQDIQLAEDALAIDNPPLALFLYQKAIHKDPHQNVQFYVKSAQTALWAKQCVQSAEYYFTAQHLATSVEDKRYLFVQAVNLLVGCNKYELAIQLAEKNIGILKDDPTTYESLTGLALKADEPEKAKWFVMKLLQLQEKPLPVRR